jgi:hypothetical protein
METATLLGPGGALGSRSLWVIAESIAERPASIGPSASVSGGPKGIRTPDLLAASQALYQLSYGPWVSESTRRPDASGSFHSSLGASFHNRSRS